VQLQLRLERVVHEDGDDVRALTGDRRAEIRTGRDGGQRGAFLLVGERQRGSRRRRPHNQLHAGARGNGDAAGIDAAAGLQQIADQQVGAGAQVLARVGEVDDGFVQRQCVAEGRKRHTHHDHGDHGRDHQLDQGEAALAVAVADAWSPHANAEM
jgi:hypothetical protein